MTHLVYLLEEQINTLFKDNNNHNFVHGVAYCMDEHTVIHAYTNLPKVIPSGEAIPAKFILLNSFNEEVECIRESKRYMQDGENGKFVLLLFFVLEQGQINYKSFFLENNKIKNCSVKLVPIKSDLYSRSKGLLETDSLSKITVGIVGLGSGGSPIALE